MNKFKLFIINGLLAFFGIASFCNAQVIDSANFTSQSASISNGIGKYLIDSTKFSNISNYNLACISTNTSNYKFCDSDGNAITTTSQGCVFYKDYYYLCKYAGNNSSAVVYYANLNTSNICPSGTPNQVCTGYKLYIADLSSGFNEYTINEDINLTYDSSDIDLYKSSDYSFEFGVNSNNRISKSNVNQNYCTSNNLCPSCQTGSNTMSSLECQTEYGLIPINEITSNYCKINFDLIDPTECPGNNTGDIIFSNLYINNTRYQGASNIFLRINDSLLYTYNYSGGQITIDVDYDVDPNYIEDIINKEKLTPTNEDFENLITGMQYYIPYIMIALLLGRAVFVFKKVFKF